MTEELKSTTNYLFTLSKWLPVWVAVAGFLLYTNTLGNDYALDDGAVIGANPYVQQGIKGIPGIFTTDTWHFENADLGYYRPLSLVTFAVENQFFQNNPGVSHLLNVLLYALTGFMLCLLLLRIFKNYHTLFSFIIALLFIAHPIHTEVVANIKGRDEILSFLNLILAMWFLLRAIGQDKINWPSALLSGFFFYLALLSKETAITGLFLIPVILYFTHSFSIKQIVKYSFPFLLLAGLFQFQKYAALGSPMGPETSDIVSFPYTGNLAEKLATSFAHLAWYTKLAFIPYPLSYNYAYNQIPASDWTSPITIAGAIIATALLFFAIKNINKKSPLALGILVFAMGLVPALAFVILKGGVLAERFLYAPSLGFCIAITWFIFKVVKLPLQNDLKATNTSAPKALPFVAIFLLYSTITISRNSDWKNDLTLSGHDVAVSCNSCQVHLHYGKKLIDDGVAENDPSKKQLDFNLGTEQLRKAIKINPHYVRAYFKLAYAYQSLEENDDSAIYYYNRSIDEAPGYALAYNNLGALYFKLGRLQLATRYLQRALQLNPNLAGATQLMQKIQQGQNGSITEVPPKPDAANDTSITFQSLSNLGVKYAQQKNFDEAQKYFTRAVQINPAAVEARVNLAVCYSMMHQYNKSETALNDALKLNPGSKIVLQNMVALYHITGNKEKEQEYTDRLKKLKP